MSDQNGLFKKLATVMGKIDRIPKNGHNAHFNYDFATADDVMDVLRPLLAEQGVALLISADEPRREGTKTLLPVTFTLVDADTGQREEMTWTGEADDRQDKGINKAATAALKYFFLKVFMISTGDPSDDADAHLDPLPEWLRDPEKVAKFYNWTLKEQDMTLDQVKEALGNHLLACNHDQRTAAALINSYQNDHA